ncbi:MAG: DUF1496 domain-containing protein [Aeromonas sobria]
MLGLLPSAWLLAHQPTSELTLDINSAAQRQCWFAGQQYSEGARIQDEGGMLECQSSDGITLNGQLGWVRLPVSRPNNDTAGPALTKPSLSSNRHGRRVISTDDVDETP